MPLVWPFRGAISKRMPRTIAVAAESVSVPAASARFPAGAASRIVAACGAVWTLTTKPPHGAGAPMESALRCVQATSGSVFDPTVVMALSEELMGEVPPVGDAARAAWARADALYSVLS